MAVLLLNITYEPIGVIAVRRAVNLLLSDKAEVVEVAPGRMVRSPSRSEPCPSVLRLRRYVNVPQRGAAWSRRGVLIRDQFTCQYCGKRMAAREATIDHIVPQWQCRTRGARPHTWVNTVACCDRCQTRKGGRSMHEAGMRFHRSGFEPRTPRANYLVLTSDMAPEWRQYIEW
jgi:5-methylcytosine-specific restriction endonuclease McrA